jgi:hypothetical protein
LNPPGLPFGVGSRVHVVPFQCAAKVSLPMNPARLAPTAQTSLADAVSTARSDSVPGRPVRGTERQALPSYRNTRL